MTSSALVLTPEDVYNVDETILFYCAQPNKRLIARKKLWAQNSKGSSHSCSCCEHNREWQFGTCDYLQISFLKLLWKVAKRICVMVCKPNGLDDILFIWQLDGEPQCTFQISKWKVFLIMDNYSLKHVGRGINWVFNLAIELYYYRFLTP